MKCVRSFRKRKCEPMFSRDKLRMAGEAVKRLRSGESITNGELNAGIEVLSVVTSALCKMGPQYQLAHADLISKMWQLESFRESRGNSRVLKSVPKEEEE